MQPRPPSLVRVLLPGDEALGRTEVQRRLGELASDVECAHDAPPSARWAVCATVEGLRCRAWMEPNAPIDLAAPAAMGLIDEAAREAAEASSFSVVVSAELGEQPLWDFHTQLRVLARLAPDGVLVIDDSAEQLHPMAWLREVTESAIPPSPLALYALHAVRGETLLWVHSHGLPRCGCIDFDILDLPAEHWGAFVPLAQAVAAQWIELGAPAPGEIFTPGPDLELLWLPSQDLLAKAKPAGPGGPDDRDGSHAGERAVLFAAGKGWTGRKPRPLDTLLPVLRSNPILYMTDMETQRMTLLAAERLPRFAALLAQHGGEEGWRFLVKLGYRQDGGHETQREHLWFEVHELRGDAVEATLLNEPHFVPGLRAGQRGEHDLDLLSDWIVISPLGEFGPDRIGELEAALQAQH